MKNKNGRFVLSRMTPGKKYSAEMLLAGVAAAIALAPAWLQAEGFRNPPAGAFSLDRAGGRITHIDDASAIAQNPANLVELEQREFHFTPSVVYIKFDYETDGLSAETENPWKLLPNTYAAMPIWDHRAAIGFGITTPYGLSVEWDKDSPAFQDPAAWRYQTPYYAQLMTIDLAPSFALKAGDYLNLGVGLNVMWSQLKLEQFYPWFLSAGDGAPDGTLTADMTGIGVGANFGATIKLTSRQRIALTLRTPIRIDYEGDLEVNRVPDSMGGGTLSGDLKSDIKYPMILAAGYGIQLTDKIRLESSVEWLQFSNFDDLPLGGNTAQTLGLPSRIRQNWKDTFTAGIAADWQVSPNLSLRGGYRFYESPVPDSTFSPTIPDANQNVITIGVNYTHNKHSVEFAYGYDFYDDRNIQNNQNPVFNGEYSISVHLFALSYRYRF